MNDVSTVCRLCENNVLSLCPHLHDSCFPSRPQLFNKIVKNGYHILYMTNKPITDSSSTRQDLSSSICHASLSRLPPGPVFLPPEALIRAFGAEQTEVFTAAAMRGIRALFPPHHSPFHAAFVAEPKNIPAYQR